MGKRIECGHLAIILSFCLSVYSALLKKRFPDRFMVWNLSEKTYDYSYFEDQVIEFRFPGYPAPPMDKIFSICNSIHGWLQADPKNVAVVHCMVSSPLPFGELANIDCFCFGFV